MLRDTDVVFVTCAATSGLAERIVNLARASEPGARVSVGPAAAEGRPALLIELVDRAVAAAGRTVAVREGGELLSRRLASVIASTQREDVRVIVLVESPSADEHSLQALAVALLDGLCFGLAASPRPVLQ